MSLSGRVALVTGGGRGIGRAISLALAGDGADVAVGFRRDEGSAMETVEAVERLGVRSRAYRASVDVLEECQQLVAGAVSDFGHVDILVVNAGVASRGNDVASTDPAELERVIRVHALGAHHLCQAVLPTMRQRPRGDVVMVSSVATVRLPARGAPYSMAKAAMEALAMTLAKEEQRYGIRVNVVAPGVVDTEMGRRLTAAVTGRELADLASVAPFGRVCTPEDVAGAVRFLVSGDAEYLTGQKIIIDGGGDPTLASMMSPR
ncbi:MAG: SDR family NAD(P)-dependent oxidoreductase [Acidimicrobiia bacterium]